MRSRLLIPLVLLALGSGLLYFTMPFSSPQTVMEELTVLGETPPEVMVAPAENAVALERSELQSPSAALTPATVALENGAALLEVLVVSPSGDFLAGVPVELWTMFRGSPLRWPGQQQVTNLQGLAVFHLPSPPQDYDRPIVAGFPFPSGKARSVQFLRSALPKTPIQLILEDIGSVEVQLLDAEGQPWTTPMDVMLAPSPGFFKNKKSVLHQEGPGFGILKSDSQGKVIFPAVALGKALVLGMASTIGSGQWGRWEVKSFSGPKTSGELLKASLRLIEPLNLVRFRLLDPDGKPVVQRDWTGTVSEYTVYPGGGFGSRGGGRYLATNMDGISLCGLPDIRNDVPWTYRALLLSCSLPGYAKPLQARLSLNREFGPGVHDVGDVQLSPYVELVSGNLVSGSGAELDNVSCKVEAQIAFMGSSSTTCIWNPLPVEFEWQENGDFRILGSTHAEKVKLTFGASGYHNLVKEVEVGRRDLNLAFETSLVIVGRLELPPGQDFDRATLRFVPPGSIATGSGYSGRVSTAILQDDGSFAFSGLRDSQAGEIAVFLSYSETALVRIPNVVPVESHVTPDSRLNPLRIRAVHQYAVSFVDQSGEPVKGVKFRIFKDENQLDPSISEDLSSSSAFSNRFQLSSQVAEIKVGYWAAGYAYGEQLVKPGDSVLTLMSPLMATLTLENTVELPAGMVLEAELLSSAAGGLVNMRQALPSFLPPVVPFIPVPSHGEYGIKLYLRDTETRKQVEVAWQDGSLRKDFSVVEGDGLSFSVSFPNQNILIAAEQLRAQ